MRAGEVSLLGLLDLGLGSVFGLIGEIEIVGVLSSIGASRAAGAGREFISRLTLMTSSILSLPRAFRMIMVSPYRDQYIFLTRLSWMIYLFFKWIAELNDSLLVYQAHRHLGLSSFGELRRLDDFLSFFFNFVVPVRPYS